MCVILTVLQWYENSEELKDHSSLFPIMAHHWFMASDYKVLKTFTCLGMVRVLLCGCV